MATWTERGLSAQELAEIATGETTEAELKAAWDLAQEANGAEEPGTTEDSNSDAERFNISAGYYDGIEESKLWAGWIEDDKKRWIIFLDPNGYPSVYYPVRESSGAVRSNPQKLDNSRTTA